MRRDSLIGSTDFKYGRVTDIGSFAFQSRRRAMLHWIRKGNPDKAYNSARECAHVANGILRVMPQDVVLDMFMDPTRRS